VGRDNAVGIETRCGLGGPRIESRVNKKVQLDATVCRHLFTATSLYMFRVSRTHHQEYQKLYLLPLVYVML